METLADISTLAQAGSTGIGIILVIYLYMKDKMANEERTTFVTAVREFTTLAGKMHESQNENKNIIEENSRVIQENSRILHDIRLKLKD